MKNRRFKVGDIAKVIDGAIYNNLGSTITITKVFDYGYMAVGSVHYSKSDFELFYCDDEIEPVYMVEGFEV